MPAGKSFPNSPARSRASRVVRCSNPLISRPGKDNPVKTILKKIISLFSASALTLSLISILGTARGQGTAPMSHCVSYGVSCVPAALVGGLSIAIIPYHRDISSGGANRAVPVAPTIIHGIAHSSPTAPTITRQGIIAVTVRFLSATHREPVDDRTDAELSSCGQTTAHAAIGRNSLGS